MNSEEVSTQVEQNGELDASFLLSEKCPGATRKFLSLVRKLEKLRNEIAKEFPEANYYLASGTLCLMLGLPHDGEGINSAHQERVGAQTIFECADGGDW